MTESTLRARHGLQRAARDCFRPRALLIRFGVHRVRKGRGFILPWCASASELLRFESRPRLLSEASTPVGVWPRGPESPRSESCSGVCPPRKAPDDSSPSASPMPLTDARSPSFPGCHERRPRLRGLVPCEDALRRFVLPRRSSLPSSGLVLPQDFATLRDPGCPAYPLMTFPPSVFASDGLGHAVFSVFQESD